MSLKKSMCGPQRVGCCKLLAGHFRDRKKGELLHSRSRSPGVGDGGTASQGEQKVGQGMGKER